MCYWPHENKLVLITFAMSQLCGLIKTNKSMHYLLLLIFFITTRFTSVIAFVNCPFFENTYIRQIFAEICIPDGLGNYHGEHCSTVCILLTHGASIGKLLPWCKSRLYKVICYVVSHFRSVKCWTFVTNPDPHCQCVQGNQWPTLLNISWVYYSLKCMLNFVCTTWVYLAQVCYVYMYR